MASPSGTLSPSLSGLEDRGAHTVRRRRYAPNADANRIVNRVQDRGSRRNDGLLADSFRPEWADGRRVLDQDGLNRRQVSDRRNQIVVEVLPLAGEELFHQRLTEALRRAALDLAFNQRGINGSADVVCGGNLPHPDGAELGVDLDLGHMRPKPENRVGHALAVFIERAGGRIEGGLRGQDIAV